MQLSFPFLGSDGPTASDQTVIDTPFDDGGFLRAFNAGHQAAQHVLEKSSAVAQKDARIGSMMTGGFVTLPAEITTMQLEVADPVIDAPEGLQIIPAAPDSSAQEVSDTSVRVEVAADQVSNTAPTAGIKDTSNDKLSSDEDASSSGPLVPQMAEKGGPAPSLIASETPALHVTSGREAEPRTLQKMLDPESGPRPQNMTFDARNHAREIGADPSGQSKRDTPTKPDSTGQQKLDAGRVQSQAASPANTTLFDAHAAAPEPKGPVASPVEPERFDPAGISDGVDDPWTQVEKRPQNAGKTEWGNPIKPAPETGAGLVMQPGEAQARITTEDRLPAPEPVAKAAVLVREAQTVAVAPLVANAAKVTTGLIDNTGASFGEGRERNTVDETMPEVPVRAPRHVQETTRAQRDPVADALPSATSIAPTQGAVVTEMDAATSAVSIEEALQLGGPAPVTSTQTSAIAVANAIKMPELPAAIAGQLAEAAKVMTDRPLEISLSPEELGKVRMTMSAQDGAMSVVLAVERPETLDLMRRNISALESQFRDLGYKDVSFSFNQQGMNQDANHDGSPDQGAPGFSMQGLPDQENAAAQATPLRVELGGKGGMDIRV